MTPRSTDTPKLIIVLGMHRSGTSAITKGLESLGAKLGGNLLPAVAGDNDKGYYEDVDFHNLNLVLLEKLGCKWDSLRPLMAEDFCGADYDALRTRARNLIAEKTELGTFCVKDPRLSVLLPFWLEVFKAAHLQPSFVIAFRNPSSVVKSLQSGLRGDVPDALGYSLWLLNNVEALYHTASYPRVVVAFEDMVNNPEHELNRISHALNLSHPTQSADLADYQSFLDPRLIRSQATDITLESGQGVPEEVRQLYAILRDLAADRRSLADTELLDAYQNMHDALLSHKALYTYADSLRSELQMLRPHVGYLEGIVDKQNDSLYKYHCALIETNESVAKLHTTLNDAYKTLNDLYNSRSWRLTAPIRGLVHKAKRFHTLAKKSHRISEELLTQDNFRKLRPLIKRRGLVQSARIIVNHIKLLEENPYIPSHIKLTKVSEYLPHTDALPKAEEIYKGFVDVIIPVYKGLDFTRKCIESVRNARCSTQHRIIIINDASPEAGVNAYIEQLKSDSNLLVHENTANLGFVKTVNLGMRLSDKHDVILLNSDTEVSDGWIDRLVAHTKVGNPVATITPFSNNATICSFPVITGQKNLPLGMTLSELNEAFYAANCLSSVEVPTGVGFCMFISREAIKKVGLFDEEAFGKGYGEENDFCLRAAQRGWRNILACDVYVFHAGEVSFQESSTKGKDNALRILAQKHPNYEDLVRAHVTQAKAEQYRIRAASAIFKANKRPTVLMVNHALGGGTKKHVDELINQVESNLNVISINPLVGRKNLVQACLLGPDIQLSFCFDAYADKHDFLKFLQNSGVSKVHYHHVLGFNPEFLSVLRTFDAPFSFTVHDYFTICPKINLVKDEMYCGELGVGQCNSCIFEEDNSKPVEITEWRNRFAWLVTDAENVICPSEDARQRMHRYFPSAPIQVCPHEATEPRKRFNIKTRKAGEKIRVAILGVLSVNKGANFIQDLISVIEAQNAPVELRLIGSSNGLVRKSRQFKESGSYKTSEITKLLEELEPDLVLFPARCPETYSYTLSEALRMGLPVLAPDVGAFPERLEHYPIGRIYPHACSAKALLDEIYALTDLDRTLLETNEYRSLSNQSNPLTFYGDLYTRGHKEANQIDLRKGGKSALIIAEDLGTVGYSSCAYIRLILPILSGEMGLYDTVRVVKQAEASRYISHDVFSHRVAIDHRHIDEVIAHCKEHSMRLIYDIDDDLLGLAHSNHPEREFYAGHSQSISRMVLNAALVTVSTPKLAHRLEGMNPNLLVRENKLAQSFVRELPTTRSKRPIGIVYMGTRTHAADFELVEDALIKIKKNYGNKVKVYIIGVTNDSISHRHFDILTPPHEVARSYPLFMHWLGSLGCFDIGIAPLVDTPFNVCKSDIKFLDYTAIGIPTVASGNSPYSHSIKDGVNGLLIDNTQEAWFNALSGLIDYAEKRDNLLDAARTYLMHERSFVL